jgi:hypothetical protein
MLKMNAHSLTKTSFSCQVVSATSCNSLYEYELRAALKGGKYAEKI